MKKIILIVMCAISFSSCKKFLAEYSQTDLVPKTTEDYAGILVTDGYPGQRILQAYVGLLSDDVECFFTPKGRVLVGNAVRGSAAFQWQPDYVENIGEVEIKNNINSWQTYYQGILGTNVAIQYMDGAIGPDDNKFQYKGEAYALRAYYYFQLVNLYGLPYNDKLTSPAKNPGVPLVLTANLSDEFIPRASVQEVYTQIERDLDSAIYCLNKGKKYNNKTRLSHVAAHLLASRVYLYEDKWEQSIAHADEVIKYHPTLMNLNTWDGYPDPESKPVTGLKNVETIWAFGMNQEQLPSLLVEPYGISTDLYNSFADNDLRKFINIAENFGPLLDIFGVVYSDMKNTISGSTTSSTVSAHFSTCFRSAEAYLNRAEAYIQLFKKGQADADNKALQSLNTLRQNRIDKYSFQAWETAPADTLLKHCREERRRELFREEAHRWFDLRRYGMPSIRHIYRPTETITEVYELKERDPQYVIPIPQAVLTRNPLLTQNTLFAGPRVAL
ncbi:SusD-like starch-binding protein associating with outer membrane [Chitinophaga skermanii]|uniref:SusD-like starch-binding protein associating with outer membrane n=1 Tax=Chitinophaga skermanii TaxID=331697 RepID=A0A327QXY8_9BACT|nr:RagB/SusD family nutrient uptake outer membrane protein [Chitinophaga skermanii]RAJ08253.1 SusD-like starch-binding protein associating with outer membrane [Chitinophaga skermanii]